MIGKKLLILYVILKGARPLERVIKKNIQDKLAMKLLSGEFSEGDFILIDVKGNGLTFKKKK